MKKAISIAIIIFMFKFIGITAHAHDFEYTVIDGNATITGFSGEPEKVVIPAEIDGVPVTSVRDNAFYKCTSLKEIILPDGLKQMGHHCFFECTSLERIVLPDSISEIGMGCFDGCSSLYEVILPEKLAVLPESCFRDCSSLRSIILPQSVTAIQKFSFAGCSSLAEISLSGNMKEIGDLAFFGCCCAGELYIPDSVESIGIRSLGYDEFGKISGFSITGKSGSAAEKYADENRFPFSPVPESADVFATQNGKNAPVELPGIFLFSGIFFLVLALISSFIKSRK